MTAMKRTNSHRLLIVTTWLAVVGSTHAQFYAPETEYHDFVQRTFVVESARVLAWRENLDNPKIREVTYRVTTGADQRTEWELSWLDEQGKTLKQTRVSYPETVLEEGPNFYRSVFNQLWKVGWKPVGSCSASNLANRFWLGAEDGGVSREEGLMASFRLAPIKPTLVEEEYSPRMAGLLAHTSLPALGGAFTLDSVLLGRAAAWLCLSEAMTQNSGETNNTLWAPVMFLSGRENAARELWKSSSKTSPPKSDGRRYFAWWDFFLRNSSTKEAFLFAAKREMRPFAMPMLVYHSRVAHVEPVLVELLEPLFDDEKRTLLRLFSYAPFLSENGGVAGGHSLGALSPVVSRQAWLYLFNEFPRQAFDYSGYEPALRAAIATSKQIGLAERTAEDSSLIDFASVAPVLKLAPKEGLGKLIPVATVTARDLLNYGWESTGLQMGARYNFVEHMWGVRELATPILNRVTREIDGLLPFFAVPLRSPTNDFAQSLYRLQLVDNMDSRMQVSAHPFGQKSAGIAAARLFYRRCWLRPQQIQWQSRSLANAGALDEVETLIRKYHPRCGPVADYLALDYLQSAREVRSLKWYGQLTEELAESLPTPNRVVVNALFLKRYWEASGFKRAQKQERLFWQFPDCDVQRRVFREYLLAGAFKAAKRFYLQVHDLVEDRVDFSNSMASHGYLLGFQSGDRKLMETALKDSDSGSFTSMLTLIWDCAARDDIVGMRSQAQELIERYESQNAPNSLGNKLMKFIPLIPALKDSTSPDHTKALDFFGKSPSWTMLRWILIQKYKLSVEDAVRFLGGPDADRVRNVLIAYLKQDNLDRAWVNFYASDDILTEANDVVPVFLIHKIKGTKIPEEEIDLRPAGVQTIKQAVLSVLEKDK